jgi:hypothetical protein
MKSQEDLVLADLTTYGWLRKDPEEARAQKTNKGQKETSLRMEFLFKVLRLIY